MLRYIALALVDEGAEAHAAYRRAIEAATAVAPTPGLAWGCKTEGACLLFVDAAAGRVRVHSLGRNGVVVGTLFRNADGASGPISSLSPVEIREIQTSRGQSLVRRHWGQYIALIEGDEGRWRIVRDPTGSFPCYYVRCNGVVFMFSHLSDCVPLLPIKLSLNYSHLHGFLRSQRFVSRHTGFNEIEAVQAGEAIDFEEHTVSRTLLWRPTSFCRHPDKHENIEESIVRMHDVVTKCVHAWAACHGSILHELSGGLDSSIVLASLATSPSAPRLVCCTHVTDACEGDERHYARLMASRVRVPLAELAARPRAWDSIDDLVRVEDPISPLFVAFQCSDDSGIEELIKTGSFDCTFSGQGGDQLFHRTLPGITAADYAWVHRFNSRLLGVILETAQVSRQPFWRVARSAIEYGCFRRPYDIWCESGISGFLRAPPIDVSQSCHPWLADRKQVPPAKLLQIMCLADTQTLFATPRSYVDEIHPLISQPLLECCLQIPTYVLSHGGTDRTIARSAFQDALPPEIVQRSSKGAVTRLFYEAVYRNRPHIRPFLLNGLLAEQGLLDRAELKRTLDDPTTIARGRSLMPIMTATIGEMWLRVATSLTRSNALPASGGMTTINPRDPMTI
jgi:asparagine synthase (glutamine-hydrolysing)